MPRKRTTETKKCGEFTIDDRNHILHHLLQNVKDNNKLKRGAINTAAQKFYCSRSTISRLWKLARVCKTNYVMINVNSRKKNCGRKPKDYSQQIKNISTIPLSKRSTLRSLAHESKIPKSTLHDRLKKGKEIKRITNFVKPLLSDENKRRRVEFCLNLLQPSGYFEDLYNYIHLDEKWFYVTKTTRKFYITAEEERPYRSCKSKKFITKVMFLAAVARPRWDYNRKSYFDGKLGIWPFVFSSPAKRNSKNRPKGTLVTQCVEVVNKQEIKKMMLQKLIPAIREKWPKSMRNSVIYLQQDNAKPHLEPNDDELIQAFAEDGWNMQLKPQPPNSPDLNVLDLGFFNSIQSIQHQLQQNNIDELIEAVTKAYWDTNRETLDNVFLSFQLAMESILLHKGCNDYKLQHMNKIKLRRSSTLQTSLKCDEKAVKTAQEFLQNNV